MAPDPVATSVALRCHRAVDRWRAVLAALKASYRARRASREERRLLAALGRAVAPTPLSRYPSLDGVRRAVAQCQGAVEAAEEAMSGSLEEDRADFAEASPWARPAVVVRGLAARAVLRDRLRRLRGARATAWAELGAAALEVGVAGDATISSLALGAIAARDRAAAALAEADRLLSPHGGTVVPAPARRVGGELVAFGVHLLKEVRGTLVPRVPALAGLAVGWWIATTFTDSPFAAWFAGFGIGRGPKRVVSSETYRAMTFWLPLAAAALCSYAGGRLGALVRARYAPGREERAHAPALGPLHAARSAAAADEERTAPGQ